MKRRRDDPIDDLIWYEAAMGEDGFDYWVLFGDKERRERAEREARKVRKQRRRVNRTQGNFSLPAMLFFVLLGFILVAIAGR